MVIGFADGEGCFFTNVTKTRNTRLVSKLNCFFSIGLHERDKALLQQIKEFLAVGSITEQGSKSIQFQVKSIKDLKVI